MADEATGGQGPDAVKGPDPVKIAPGVAAPARVLNYLAGGDDNFSADRAAADDMGAALPGGLDTARIAVRALAAFAGRVVRRLAGDHGITQFLNIGAGIPMARTAHEVAQEVAVESRFVYVGDDPVVLAHAHELRASGAGAATAYVEGNIRDPEAILRQAAGTLDLTRPIAVMLLTTLNFVPDDEHPGRAVDTLVDAIASGSHVALAHPSSDLGAEGMKEAAERLNDAIALPYVVRSRVDIARFLDRLELLEPGLVQIDEWHPGPRPPVQPEGRPTPILVGVARKP